MKSKMCFNKFEVLEFVNSLNGKLDINGSAAIGGWGLKLTDGRSFYEPNFNHWVGRMATELDIPLDKDMSRKYGSHLGLYFKEEKETVAEDKIKVVEEVVESTEILDLGQAKKIRTKKALDKYAQGFGYELDARKSLKNMVKELESLI